MATPQNKTTIGNQASKALDPAPEVKPLIETPEEREEALAAREEALAEREMRLFALEQRMQASIDRLERAATGTKSEEDIADEPVVEYDAEGREIPRLDLTMPYGTVIGDADAGFVQNGHRFTKDRRYLCDEPKGAGKPFNIKMLGLVKVVAKAA